MRREFIYTHKSFRSLVIPKKRVLIAIGTALALSSVVARWSTWMITVHGEICRWLLEMTRVPTLGFQTLPLFGGLGPASAPTTSVLRYGSNPVLPTVVFICLALMLLAIHRRFPFLRNLVLFLLTLQISGAAVVVIDPFSRFDSSMLTQMWLRSEVLVWLLLPWVSALLFILIHPSPLMGIVWTLLTQVYGFLWSAVRLTYCQEVLHYMGVPFLSILWFCLGLMADLLYLLLFYSIAVHRVGRKAWGQRA